MRVLLVRPCEVLLVIRLRLFLNPVHQIVDTRCTLLFVVLHHFDPEDVMHLVEAVIHDSVLHPLCLSGQIDGLNGEWNDVYLHSKGTN